MKCLLFLATALLVSADYTEADDVVILTKDNFDSLVVKGTDLWLVEFYAPWCGHCKTLEPEWKKAAKALQGIAKLGAVDMTTQQEVGAPYQVQGFPTLKAFLPGNKESLDYDSGKRTAPALAAWALKTLKVVVRDRLGMKEKKPKKEKVSEEFSSDYVVTLTDSSFDEQVLQSKEFWLVVFYAPWCGHCKHLSPEWVKAAARLEGKVKLGAVDATIHNTIASKYDIKGYPTIKVFADDDKSEAEEYTMGNTAKDIVEFCAVRGGFEIPSEISGENAAPKKDKKKKKTSAVVELTDASFQSEVMESEELWLVEFYAPWCGHCKNLAPHWNRAANEVEGKAKLGAVDATLHPNVATQYGVSGYPTIKVFAAGKKGEAEEYQGGRDTETIVKEVNRLLGAEPEPEDEGETASVILNDANFESEVLKSSDLWLIEFFAPWCGHCKNLVPHWKTASVELDGRVKMGTVDCTAVDASSLKDKFDIQSFPTIKFFAHGEMLDYNGGMSHNGIVDSSLKQLEEHMKEPRTVRQLTSQKVFDEECTVGLCVIAVLPHILDTQAEGRNKYIDTLREQAVVFKNKQIGFLWVEPLAQDNLEDVLRISGSGYPAMAVLNHKKSRMVPFLRPFSNENIQTFLKSVNAQREKSSPFQTFKIVEAAAWDGKDGELPQEHDEL